MHVSLFRLSIILIGHPLVLLSKIGEYCHCGWNLLVTSIVPMRLWLFVELEYYSGRFTSQFSVSINASHIIIMIDVMSVFMYFSFHSVQIMRKLFFAK